MFEPEMLHGGLENINTSTPGDDEGVLLYYRYVPLTEELKADVAEWYRQQCSSLQLRGRIRVANDGVNVTVGGGIVGLQRHIAAATAHPLLGGGVDYKLAASPGPHNGCPLARTETKFDRLDVRLCQELVTLGPRAARRADPHLHAGQHLTPHQFHQKLLEASQGAGSGSCQTTSGQAPQGVVLVDARNLYESRIGHFKAGTVPLLLPRTRCFGNLPAWLDHHEGELRDKTVLMYCTGGVRCERASAYLREKGAGFQDVYQLHGGIQRYLEAFPVDGLFHGKNFVYDERLAVAPNAGAASSIQDSARITATDTCVYDERPSVAPDMTVASSPLRPDAAVATSAVTLDAASASTLVALDAAVALTQAVTANNHIDGTFTQDLAANTTASTTTHRSVASTTTSYATPGSANTSSANACTQDATANAATAATTSPRIDPSSLQPLAGRATAADGSSADTVAPDAAAASTPQDASIGRRPNAEPATTSSAAPSLHRFNTGHDFPRSGSSGSSRSTASVVGRCLVCATLWDDYGARVRCRQCRLLLLVCGGCQRGAAADRGLPLQLLCELCTERKGEPARGARSRSRHASQHSKQAPALLHDASHHKPAPSRQASSPSHQPSTPSHLEPLLSHQAPSPSHQAPSPSRQAPSTSQRASRPSHQPLAPSHLEPSASHQRPSPSHQALSPSHQAPAPSHQAPSISRRASSPSHQPRPPSHQPPSQSHQPPSPSRPLLRILCLHGFRQTARQFAGRAAALRRRLRSVAELVFVDGPHALPLLMRHQKNEAGGGQDSSSALPTNAATPNGFRKRAWLVSPELLPMCSDPAGDSWQPAPSFVTADQHLGQTEGWAASWQLLCSFIDEHGPFDGVLGFSQGAAIAAVLCTLQQLQQLQQEAHQRQPHPTSTGARAWTDTASAFSPSQPHRDDAQQPAEMTRAPLLSADSQVNDIGHGGGDGAAAVAVLETPPPTTRPCRLSFQFAVLASGFLSPAPEHAALFAAAGPLRVPSMHIYGDGSGGLDRQVGLQQSEQLEALFDSSLRHCLRHGSGHFIPAAKEDAAPLVEFLAQFQPTAAHGSTSLPTSVPVSEL